MANAASSAAPRGALPAWSILAATLLVFVGLWRLLVYVGLWRLILYFGDLEQALCGPGGPLAVDPAALAGATETAPFTMLLFGETLDLLDVINLSVAAVLLIWVLAAAFAALAQGRGLLYDARVRSVALQAFALWAVTAAVLWVVGNTIDNYAAQDKKFGFDFLCLKAGFQIRTTLGTYVADYSSRTSTYLDVFIVGLTNTLIMAFTGIIAATLIGFVMGVFRLSKNPVLRGFATLYVETLRNLPLLLQIFFWGAVLSAALPPKRPAEAAFSIGDVHVNVDGVFLPFPIPQEGFNAVLIALGAAVLLTIIIRWLARRRQNATGQRLPVFWIGLALIIGAPLATFLYLDSPLIWEPAVARRFGFRVGDGQGMLIGFTFWQLWIALVLYTGSFIAEIVRAGILAVPWGQTEAARSVGMPAGLTLRKIIIPQAMRVIIPPLTSQFLNLTKNSSLAAAIAYPDVVGVFAGTALNQAGRAIEMVFMMMTFYLVVSLLTAAFMNWFNNRMKLVER